MVLYIPRWYTCTLVGGPQWYSTKVVHVYRGKRTTVVLYQGGTRVRTLVGPQSYSTKVVHVYVPW